MNWGSSMRIRNLPLLKRRSRLRMESELYLLTNEVYGPTIQGEGKCMGQPVKFLRTAVCNLQCIWCDTWYTWNFGKGDGVEERFGSKTVKREDELHKMSIPLVAEMLNNIACPRLVISGGEPMLQQEALLQVILACTSADIPNPLTWIEIETNGTQLLKQIDQRGYTLADYIHQINCSPKLENSGNPKEARYKPEVLKQYQATGKAEFKFVVQSDGDLIEIEQIVAECGLKNVWLMPQGKTKEEQSERARQVAELAANKGWNFSPRLHIELWGSKRKT